MLQQREVKRYLIERKSILKWQQILTILDSQSDAIVAIQSNRDRASKDKERKLPIIFTNKKSQALLEFNIMDEED